MLELPSSDTLGSGGLRAVTLDLNGGSIGSVSGTVSLVVKSSGTYTAPSGDGLTRPTGNTGAYFKWQDSNGNLYEPGDTVPADVTGLTALWEPYAAPAITTQPTAQSVTVGQTAAFTVTANGVPAPTYQWQVSKDGGSQWEDIPGATTANYTTPSTTMDMNGWQYRCVVTNAPVSVTSDPAALTVSPISLSGASVTLDVPENGYTYDGTAKQPSVTVTLGGQVLAQGMDYTVTYDTDCTSAGTKTVQIKGMGDYDGITGTAYEIAKAEITVKADDKTAYVGDTPPALTYTVTGLVNGETLKTQPTLAYESEPDMSKAGVTTIKASGAEAPDSSNYLITYLDGSLTVSVRPSSGGDNNGGNATTPTYPPALVASEGGTVRISPATPKAGDTVTVTPKPNTGNEVEQVTVTSSGGKAVAVKDNGDNTFSFTQPSGKVTVKVVFRKAQAVWVSPYADVDEGAWYYEAVRYVRENGLMNGTAADAFSPDMTTDRAMLVTILWRMADSPSLEGEIWGYPYADVDVNAYYGTAVYWARLNDISSGYGDGTFGPDDALTREQLAVMLWRQAGSPDSSHSLSQFSDAAQIGDYAQTALAWANENGIVSGHDNGTLAPRQTATRAEIAQMLMRFAQASGQ